MGGKKKYINIFCSFMEPFNELSQQPCDSCNNIQSLSNSAIVGWEGLRLKTIRCRLKSTQVTWLWISLKPDHRTAQMTEWPNCDRMATAHARVTI